MTQKPNNALKRMFLCGLVIALASSILLNGASDAGSLPFQSPPPTPPYAIFLPIIRVPGYTYLPLITKEEFVRPNFVIILSDDQRYDTLDFMPLTQARIFDRGITFTNAHVTTSLCCPSRSSILTGMYAHHHGVYYNDWPLDKTTFVQRLHDAGYLTGNIGKYLNSWDGSYRAEFDQWVVFAGPGASQYYFNRRLNVNGEWIQSEGYVTWVLRDYALRFLDDARQRQQPFLLIFAPNAPHQPGTPAPGDEDLYPDLLPHRPVNYYEGDLSDKPLYIQNRFLPNPTDIDNLRRKQLQSLHALDIAVAHILDRLAVNGQDRNTVIMYLSDNGLFWGEHRLDGKLYGYTEGTHVPFAIRYDRLIAQPIIEPRLVANIDIAPTIYELAGLPIPPEVDGRSLIPLMRRQAIDWRTWLIIEGWAYYPYAGIRTDRFLYIETDGDTDELYDRLTDPYEMQSQINNPAYASAIADLHNLLVTARPAGQHPARWHILTLIRQALQLDD